MASRIRQLRADEGGMTLIELVVATAAGMVLFLGLTMMVLASMHQTTRISNRVHTTQDARTATQRIVNELQTACAARYLTPVRTGSTGTKLKFARAYGSAVSPTPVMSEVKLVGSGTGDLGVPGLRRLDPGVGIQRIDPDLQKRADQERQRDRRAACRSSATTNSATARSPARSRSGRRADRIADRQSGESRHLLQGQPAGHAGHRRQRRHPVQDSALLRFSSPTYVTTSNNLPCE